MRGSLSPAVVIALLAGATLCAQSALPLRTFDVASVKPDTTENEPRGISFSPSGRFAWNRMTLAQLMESAYAPLAVKEIVGGPSWVRSARFDIAATSADALKELDAGGAPIGLFERLRALLEERFALRTHVEQRELASFVLEPAADPVVLGRSITRVDADCEAVTRDLAARGPQRVAEGQLPLCAFRSSLGLVRGHAMTLAQLAEALTAPAGRPVVDSGRLAGVFDIELRWAPELPPGALINGQPAAPSDGPSLFTAVREQLGLRLQPARRMLPVLVIDSVQMPTPD